VSALGETPFDTGVLIALQYDLPPAIEMQPHLRDEFFATFDHKLGGTPEDGEE
jgi:hypothetical protein